MSKGPEGGLNTMDSESKNVMNRVEQKFALGIGGNKVFRQSKVRSLESLEI